MFQFQIHNTRYKSKTNGRRVYQSNKGSLEKPNEKPNNEGRTNRKQTNIEIVCAKKLLA